MSFQAGGRSWASKAHIARFGARIVKNERVQDAAATATATATRAELLPIESLLLSLLMSLRLA